MFRFRRKNNTPTEIIPADSVEGMMGMSEYVSVDSIKAHLVELFEENRNLRDQLAKLQSEKTDLHNVREKEKTVLSVAADEYKKQVREKEHEIYTLNRDVRELNNQIEKYQLERNDLITHAECVDSEIKQLRRKNEELMEERKGADGFVYELVKEFAVARRNGYKNITKTAMCEKIEKIFEQADGVATEVEDV